MCPSCADVFCFAGGALIITASAALPFSLSGGVLWRLYHYHYHYHAYAYAHAHAHIHILLWFLWHAPQKHSKKKRTRVVGIPTTKTTSKQTNAHSSPLFFFCVAASLLCFRLLLVCIILSTVVRDRQQPHIYWRVVGDTPYYHSSVENNIICGTESSSLPLLAVTTEW